MQQLLGNERLLKELNTAVKENRIAHAYLLCGGEGSGKKTLADMMCRMFLCSDGGCGRCAVCAKLEKNIHPDVVHITGATKSGNYSVDQIRSLRREALVYPNEAGKKIYILHQAEKLTPNAQDAFLKILEEPPEFVVFLLLCSDESKLLATIHSRVIRLAMETPDSEESLNWLIGKTGEEASLCTVALGISGGNPFSHRQVGFSYGSPNCVKPVCFPIALRSVKNFVNCLPIVLPMTLRHFLTSWRQIRRSFANL